FGRSCRAAWAPRRRTSWCRSRRGALRRPGRRGSRCRASHPWPREPPSLDAGGRALPLTEKTSSSRPPVSQVGHHVHVYRHIFQAVPARAVGPGCACRPRALLQFLVLTAFPTFRVVTSTMQGAGCGTRWSVVGGRTSSTTQVDSSVPSMFGSTHQVWVLV